MQNKNVILALEFLPWLCVYVCVCVEIFGFFACFCFLEVPDLLVSLPLFFLDLIKVFETNLAALWVSFFVSSITWGIFGCAVPYSTTFQGVLSLTF